jgi:uncharacterized membrane protein YjjP (DUF1212 family)
MDNQDAQTDGIMEACLLAGKIMLQSGAETYRVEDTMMRMAASFGIKETNSYVTPTGIIFSADHMGPTKTKLLRILDRSTDLTKVTMVNSISRQISSGSLNLEEAVKQLKKIDSLNLAFPMLVQAAASSIASGCFLIMFNGGWNDFLPAMIAGGAGYISLLSFHRFIPIKFFSEFLASFVIGLVTLLFVKIGMGHQLDKIVIGSVMTLVPGLLITNAVRDLMAGHLVSGLSKGAEAFLTAFAIGSGIAIVLSFLR